MSNVLYKLTCSRDASTSYIGMATRHLGTKFQKHLHSKNFQGKLPRKTFRCKIFEVITSSCNSEYETKTQEALLIKKYNPPLNKQLYAKESFLLNVY